ncbi:histidine kinase [Lysobacteraceae bacterium NML75-0749]|nr:histidine kinase [Xanthomonadaceae bacterium NML75-0749]PJK05902.1 histidine kinase [Xanthomonadaceae bacterium NML91-0268]
MRPVNIPPPDSPLFLLWKPKSILLSMLLAEMVAIILSLTPGLMLDPLVYLGLMSLLLQWITLSTIALTRLLARWLVRISTTRLLGTLVLLLTLSAALMSSISGWLFPEALFHGYTRVWYSALQIPALILVLGVLGALAFHRHWESKQLALRAKQAELDVLRARVDPHFLFNSLNAAVSLIHIEPDQAERVLLDLSDLFRAALASNELHPLSRELELTRRYLAIEKLRLGERLQVQWHLPRLLPETPIPSLSLQTLTENAVRHGIEKMPHGGQLAIRVLMNARRLRLQVSNPMPQRPNRPESTGHSVGIAATRARIEAISQGQGRLLTFIENGEYVAEIVLPQ